MKHNLLYLLFILLFGLVACGSEPADFDTADNDSAQFSDNVDEEGDFEDEGDFNGEDNFDNEDDLSDEEDEGLGNEEEDFDEEGDDFDDEEGDDESTENHAIAPPDNTPYAIVDIAPIPDHFPDVVRDTFDRYTQIIAPNGKPIDIYAQSDLSDAQIILARDMLVFFLTDVPGSQFGADKTAIANKMGDNEAMLMLLNGQDYGQERPDVPAQDLYAEELVIPGSDWYINNEFADHRDATFEEILHLVQDAGIGVDGHNSQPGALPAYQANIRAATNNAMENNFEIWPIGADSDSETMAWFDENVTDNNLTQEYLATVVDSYYGLWGPYTDADGGMWGWYIAKTRADIEAQDPMGWALMQQFFSPYLTFNIQLDPDFDGTFLMSFDASEPYTHKSQYILHATLTGDNSANLTGNDQDNQLGGNSSDNMLDGLAGNDTAVYPRAMSNYTITNNTDGTITVVGDGTDMLINIEQIAFSDQTINAKN